MFTKTHEEIINLFESDTNYDQGLSNVIRNIHTGNKDYIQAVIDISHTVLSDDRFNKEGKTMALNLIKEGMATNQHFFAVSLTKPKVLSTFEELALKSRSLGPSSLYPSKIHIDNNLPSEFYMLLKDLLKLWGIKYDKSKDATFKFALLYQKLKDKGVQFANDYEHLTKEEVKRYSVTSTPGVTPREGEFQQPCNFTPRRMSATTNTINHLSINVDDSRGRAQKFDKSYENYNSRSKSSDFRLDTPSFLSENYATNVLNKDTSKSRLTVDFSRPALKLNTTTNIDVDDHPALFADSLLSTVFDISSIEVTHGERRAMQLRKHHDDDENSIIKLKSENFLDSNISGFTSVNKTSTNPYRHKEYMEPITERASDRSMTYRTPKKDMTSGPASHDNLLKENDELKEKISRLKELIIIEKEKNNAPRQDSSPQKDYNLLQTKYETLKKEMTELKEQNTRLLDVIDVQNLKIENYKRETGKAPESFIATSEAAKAERDSLIKQNGELKDSLDKEKIRLQSLVATIDSYRKIIEDLQSELAKKEKDNVVSSDKSVLVPICEKNKELTFKIQSLETALSKNQEKSKLIVGQNKELREKNAEFDLILKQELQKHKKVKEDLLKKEIEIKHLTDRILSAESGKPVSNNQVYEDLKEKLNQEIEKNQSLRTKLAEKTKEHIDEIKTIGENHRDEMMKLTDEIMRLNNNIEEIQNENLKTIERNKELEQAVFKIKNVDDDRTKVETQLKSKIFQIQTQNQDLRTKVDQLESQIDDLQRERDELQSTIQHKEEDFHQLLKQQIEDLRNQYKEKEEKLKQALEDEKAKFDEYQDSHSRQMPIVLEAFKSKEKSYRDRLDSSEHASSRAYDNTNYDASSVPTSEKLSVDITPKSTQGFHEFNVPASTKRVVIKKERVNSAGRTRDARSEKDDHSTSMEQTRHRSVPRTRNMSCGSIHVVNSDLGFTLRKNLELDGSSIHSYHFENDVRDLRVLTDLRQYSTNRTGVTFRPERTRNGSASSLKNSNVLNVEAAPRTSRFSIMAENEQVDLKHIRRLKESFFKDSAVIIENEYLRVEVSHEIETNYENTFPDLRFFIKYQNKSKHNLENFEISKLNIPGFMIIGEEKPSQMIKPGNSHSHILKLRFKTLETKLGSFVINFRANELDVSYRAKLPTVVYKLLKFRNITSSEFIESRKAFLTANPQNLVDTGKIALSDGFFDLLNKTLFEQMCEVPTEGKKGSRFSVYGAALILEPIKTDFYLRAILENSTNLCIFQMTYAGPSKGFAEAILDLIKFAGDERSSEL